jgi:hypothetical protein
MARQDSQPMLVSLIRLLAEHKMDSMTLLFMDALVPREFDPQGSGAGRLGRALAVVNTVAENPECGDALNQLFDVVIANNRSLLEQHRIGLPVEIYGDDPSGLTSPSPSESPRDGGRRPSSR